MKETRAILFVFEGESIPENYAISIGQNLGLVCDAAKVTNFIFSAQDIAKCIVSREVPELTGKSASIKQEEKTPEDEAVIYIGTIMQDALTAPFDAQVFASQIIRKVNETKANFVPEVHKQFMNALFILSQENLVVSKTLMKKYHFSQEKLTTIKKTYNFLTKF